MKGRLFLTGPMGCGKSTVIAKALGNNLSLAGGFLTRRHGEGELFFTLDSPDGRCSEVFLRFQDGQPVVDMDVFSGLAVSLLKGGFLVLDEIGGVELLCPEFAAALDAVLESGIPIIGVMKGEGPAGALTEALGLSREYEQAASGLRRRLREDSGTLLYECGQFDETALLLAENWVKEYTHEELF